MLLVLRFWRNAKNLPIKKLKQKQFWEKISFTKWIQKKIFPFCINSIGSCWLLCLCSCVYWEYITFFIPPPQENFLDYRRYQSFFLGFVEIFNNVLIQISRLLSYTILFSYDSHYSYISSATRHQFVKVGSLTQMYTEDLNSTKTGT